jgi:hypothetical protein
VGSPVTHTDAMGQFTVAVPPMPSEISFSSLLPDSVYENNLTFVNVSSGASLDIGTVYLQQMTVVEYSVFDSVTGDPIGVPGALTVCSRITDFCAPQGTTVYGPNLTAFAPVGPDMAHVLVDGYVLDQTVLGVVPPEPIGAAPVQMGEIHVVPLGGMVFWANITGVPAPYGNSLPTSEWPVGDYAIISSCSLDGLSYAFETPTGNMSSSDCTGLCAAPGTEAVMAAIPLRDFVRVEPDEVGCILPGYPTWPIPGDLPVFQNYAWVNITPDELTNAGGIDLLPGTYIEGQVLPAAQSGWDIAVCSTDEPNECGEGSYADQQYYGSYTFFAPNGCPQPTIPATTTTKTTFCVAAPPGPDELRVTPSNASANYTWAYNPPLQWNQVPLPLSRADQDLSGTIEIGPDSVYGEVLQALSYTPVLGLPSVQVCPAGVSPSAVICGGSVANATGYFKVNAPPGWDSVTISAPDYEPNTTWVYVNQSNSTGIILLVPYGYVTGQVVDAAGQGIYEATVDLCRASSPDACAPIGSDGLTSTDGVYYGATPAGPPPIGAYEVKATAPGYQTDWTWVNVTTPGENFTAPTIVLQLAAGTGGASAPARDGRWVESGSTSANLPGAWVTGSVTDLNDGVGLIATNIVATPSSGATPTVFSSIRATGGEFNESLPDGDYTLSFAMSGFYGTSSFLNVSGNASVISLGTIPLMPMPTVTGRLVIAPAAWAEDVTIGMGLGPGVGTVQICSPEATGCGPGGVVSVSGYFNASAPAGDYDLVLAGGTGGGIGSAAGGFISARTYVNVTNGSVSANMPNGIGLSVFGIITGSVVNANYTSAATRPVRYDQITADTTFPIDATEAETLTADGTYAIIFPESNGLNMTAGGLGSWIPVGVGINVNGSHQGGPGNYTLKAGDTITLDPISVEHFGWVDARAVAGVNGSEVPYATIDASVEGSLWGLPNMFTATAVANGAGFVNLSAPPSMPDFRTKVSLTISAPDFGSMKYNVAVNASRTTYLNGTTARDLTGVPLVPWGWIVGTVEDAMTGRLLNDVSVSGSAQGLPVGKTGVTTNGLGYYRIDAPPKVNDTLSLVLDGYSANRTIYNLTAGEQLNASTVKLTGDGIVAGRVVSSPGAVPVSGATVSVCPIQRPSCAATVVTNVSGDFWLAAAPGQSAVTIGAPGFVTNTSTYLDVVTDSWTWIGDLTVQRYAYVTGTILGLPSGLPLAGATVGVCAPLPSGIGAGPCVTSVQSEADGSFYIPVAAGVYVINGSAPGYNATFLPISLVPGETLPIGLLFVEQYGTATGAIYGADTDQPAPAATIVACESWGAHVCSTPTPAETGGAYVVTDPAGPIELEASAAGYQTGFRAISLSPGATVTVPTFFLVPIGPNTHYEVRGNVTVGAANGTVLTGAVVTALGAQSTPTNSSGGFSLDLTWGNYTIVATDPGYVSVSRTVDVTSALAGVDFALPLMTYAVHGLITDGLTGRAIPNVAIRSGGSALGTTAANGSYSVGLTNGSHELVVTGPAPYGTVSVQVVVAGAAVSEPILLYPLSVSVNGVVVNALSGLPVASATVTFTGTTDEGTPWNSTVISGAAGRFLQVAYPGAYTARVSVAGYAPAQTAVVVNGTDTAVPLTLSLEPASSTAAASTPPLSATVWIAAGVASAAVVAVAVAVLTLRSGASATRGKERRPGSNEGNP